MAGVMEVLKQIQRDLLDQKEFIRIKFNLMEGKIYELDKKIDQQQTTIEKLEQQIKKMNVAFIGNEDGIEFEDKSTMFDKTDLKHKETEGHLVEQVEKYVDNSEVNQPWIDLEVTKEDENNKVDNDKNVSLKCSEQSNTVKFTKEDKKNCNYEIYTDKDRKENNCVFLATEMKEIKDMIKEYMATRKEFIEEAVSPMCKQGPETQTIRSPDQIRKFNEDVEIIDKKYANYNNTQILNELYLGVQVNPFERRMSKYRIKLGMTGFKRSEVINLLRVNPHFDLNDVVKEALCSTNEWNELAKIYNFDRITYNNY